LELLLLFTSFFFWRKTKTKTKNKPRDTEEERVDGEVKGGEEQGGGVTMA